MHSRQNISNVEGPPKFCIDLEADWLLILGEVGGKSPGQMNDQFKESSMNQNEAKERAKIIRDKIQFYWNETLSKRKDFFWKRLRNQKSAELYEIYSEKNFVPRKFRTKLPDNCTEREKQLLGNLAIDRVKHEIIILKNRSSEFKEKYE